MGWGHFLHRGACSHVALACVELTKSISPSVNQSIYQYLDQEERKVLEGGGDVCMYRYVGVARRDGG